MRVRLAMLALLLAAATGCEAVQLRNHIERQAATLPDIEYQEVLDNLAMFVQEPDALPYFLLTPSGSVQIQQTATAGGGVNWDYSALGSTGAFLNHADKKMLTLSENQQTVSGWSAASLTDPTALTLMRCAYQRTIGCAGSDCEDKLQAFFKYNQGRLDALRGGWYGAGCLKDVPKNACHVGHYGHTYVWVTPEGMNSLTTFTLAILDIVTTLTPKPDLQLVQLAELEGRMTVLSQILDKMPDKETVQADELRNDLNTLIGQYHALLKAHLKEKPGPASLFDKIRRDFNLPPPQIVPLP